MHVTNLVLMISEAAPVYCREPSRECNYYGSFCLNFFPFPLLVPEEPFQDKAE